MRAREAQECSRRKEGHHGWSSISISCMRGAMIAFILRYGSRVRLEGCPVLQGSGLPLGIAG